MDGRRILTFGTAGAMVLGGIAGLATVPTPLFLALIIIGLVIGSSVVQTD